MSPRLRRDALRALRRRMQMVFQDPYGSLDPRMTVRRRSSPSRCAAHGVAARRSARGARAATAGAASACARHAPTRYPHEFSGGQRQRIGIARALALEPELVVLRRAGVSALDVSIQAQILNLLQDLQAELGLAYLFIAHDLARGAAHLATASR